MTIRDARLLATALAAAFPFPRVPSATVDLYTEQLAALPDTDAARTAVKRVIEEADRFPPLVMILREYRWYARRNADELARVRGLDEPPPDPANAEKARALLRRLTNAVGDMDAA